MEMKKQLPSSLKKKQVPLPSLDTHDPDHKILSGAFEALQKISREKAEAWPSTSWRRPNPWVGERQAPNQP